MDKNEVVIKLHDCRRYLEDKEWSDSIAGQYIEVLNNVIAILKEQNAIEPIRDAICVRMFCCGACGEYVGFIDSDPSDSNEQDNYCRNCGRKVKWN